ncbi:MAG: hypothetical protein O3B13_18295, partial [Planctomycetota bacterium]|nr:hypothetical protein [Planctomycetota bacterium]
PAAFASRDSVPTSDTAENIATTANRIRRIPESPVEVLVVRKVDFRCYRGERPFAGNSNADGATTRGRVPNTRDAAPSPHMRVVTSLLIMGANDEEFCRYAPRKFQLAIPR